MKNSSNNKSFLIQNQKMFPNVCVVCPTYNRPNNIPFVIHQFHKQNYPSEKKKLLILDDSTSGKLTDDFFDSRKCNMVNVHYTYLEEKTNIYDKRNLLNKLAIETYDAEIIVCMDDDDIYSSWKIYESVQKLLDSKKQIVGCNTTYILYTNTGNIHKNIVQNHNYASNGTMAYSKSYAMNHKHVTKNNYVISNEEESFTNGFTEDMCQLDPENIVLMIAHENNTVCKDKLRKHGTKVSENFRKYLINKFISTDEYIKTFLQRNTGLII